MKSNKGEMKMKKFKTIFSLIVILFVTSSLYACTSQSQISSEVKTTEQTIEQTTEQTIEQTNDSYVTMDINPSVGIVVDDNNIVVAIHPLNEDGEILLLNLDLINQNIDIVLELLLDKSIELGFIDVEAIETLVEISVIGNDLDIEQNVRERVQNRVRVVLEERNIPTQVREKVFTQELINEAAALNMTPRQYQLIKTAMMADPSLTIEEARNIDVEKLVQTVRANNRAMAEVAQSLKDEFLAAKQAVLDTYLPLIEQLEADIAAATLALEPTEALELELTELIAEMEAAHQAVVDEFVSQTTSLRLALQVRHNSLVEQNRQKVEDFIGGNLTNRP